MNQMKRNLLAHINRRVEEINALPVVLGRTSQGKIFRLKTANDQNGEEDTENTSAENDGRRIERNRGQ